MLLKELHYAKSSYTWVFSRTFSVPCAPLSVLGNPSRTDCDGVCFLVHTDWNSRDVSIAG